MDVRAVIFDLDGTLFDKRGLALRLVWSQIKCGHLLTLRRERQVRRLMAGRHFADGTAFETAFFSHFPKPEKVRDWYHHTYMPEMVQQLRLHYRVAGWVQPQFRELRDAGVLTAVFSDYGCVREKLEAIGFDPLWADFLFEAPALGGLKPCKESFGQICEVMGVLPDECLMVGDRDDTDGAGARAAGMGFRKVYSAEPAALRL